MTNTQSISFDDGLCGPVTQCLKHDIGDFVLRRADGLMAYQLAVVVDDAFQGINRVVRGADLLTSTPRQIYLQSLLGYETPCYTHLPLVLDYSGRKLSKQDHAHPVDKRAPLEALIAALEFLKQPVPSDQPSNLDEFWYWAIDHWNIERSTN